MRKLLCLALLSVWTGLPAFGAPARLPESTEIQRIVVKFHEGTAVRLRGGALAAQSRDERDRRDLSERGLSPSAVDGDLAEVHRLAARGIVRLFLQEERVLAERRFRGEARSGRRLADLDLYYEVRVAPGTKAGEVSGLLDALNALGSVETAYAETPPALPAGTPDFQSLQGYLDPAPEGIDALYAWTQAGGTGEDVKIVDIEGGWRTTHEDMPVLFHTNGSQIPGWENHGTAVLGELVAKNNGF
ncbi:MAG TPA: peptidase S8, partial [Thermoanaerobaculia bacterium]|nr:peptidase S8 [Thermoanaerobaculia bacterium]